MQQAYHHHDLHEARYKLAKHVTWIAIWMNALLVIVKIFFGLLWHSHALVADGVHSIADLLTGFLVLVAARLGNHAPDEAHPYGHQRIETAATVALAVFLIGVGFAIIGDSAWHMLRPRHIEMPHAAVLIVAIFSVLTNEAVFRYTLKIANRVNSDLLRANAWHARSDAASSLVVLIGVAAALMGYPFLDRVAAIAVGALVINMGWELTWNSVKELIDTGVDNALLEDIKKIILTVPGVDSIHDLRTRYMGGRVFVDVHVLVNPQLSVSEGHYIGEQVHLSLIRAEVPVSDVIVHVDPEDDETAHLNADLPAREAFTALLREKWAGLPGLSEKLHVHLHYFAGKINVALILPLDLLQQHSAVEIETLYRMPLEDVAIVGSVVLLFGREV